MKIEFNDSNDYNEHKIMNKKTKITYFITIHYYYTSQTI